MNVRTNIEIFYRKYIADDIISDVNLHFKCNTVYNSIFVECIVNERKLSNEVNIIESQSF